VEDGKQVATAKADSVLCLAVSKDGTQIAAGILYGGVFVWNAKTCEKVISHRDPDAYNINGVDFSPDSTRLVSASNNGTATIWDIPTRERVQTLGRRDLVNLKAAKYSPQGDRIAIAARDSVRVYDSNNSHLLMNIPVTVTPWRNTGLLWYNNHIFVISDTKIKQLEASTGSVVSEWPVPNSNWNSCIVLSKYGKFIACSTQRSVTFWNTATHTQLGVIRHPQDIRSIAVSPDYRFLAIGGRDGKITIHSLSRIIVSILSRWIMVHMNNFLAPINLP
jgi:WD40 repeat protein